MRRDEKVGATPERMLRGQRFGVRHIERGANLAFIQRVHQRVCLDNCATGGIDHESALPHPFELSRADQAPRFIRQGQDENDDIGLRQQAVQLAHRMHPRSSARAASHADQLHMKRRQHPLNLLPDGSVSNQQHGLFG